MTDLTKLESAMSFASGKFGCLSCDGIGKKKTRELVAQGQRFSALGPSEEQIAGVVTAIKDLGLNPKDVDDAVERLGVAEGKRRTHLAEGTVGPCISPTGFLSVIQTMLG